MNAMGDDHVSFSASHLAVSPCRRFLLVSTDGSRIIMFRVKGKHSNIIPAVHIPICCRKADSEWIVSG